MFQRDPEDSHRDRERDRERERERRKRHKEKHFSHGPLTMGLEKPDPVPPATSSGGVVAGDITKVFYYMLNDKTETPYVTLVPGK